MSKDWVPDAQDILDAAALKDWKPTGLEFRDANRPDCRTMIVTAGPYKGWVCRTTADGRWYTDRLLIADDVRAFGLRGLADNIFRDVFMAAEKARGVKFDVPELHSWDND